VGKPLDEPSKVLGFIPFSDAIILAGVMFLDGLFFLAVSKRAPFLTSVGLTFGILFSVVFAFFLKNIFPKGFFRGMFRYYTSPQVYLPGREKSEL
jgi:hypothetical protein